MNEVDRFVGPTLEPVTVFEVVRVDDHGNDPTWRGVYSTRELADEVVAGLLEAESGSTTFGASRYQVAAWKLEEQLMLASMLEELAMGEAAESVLAPGLSAAAEFVRDYRSIYW